MLPRLLLLLFVLPFAAFAQSQAVTIAPGTKRIQQTVLKLPSGATFTVESGGTLTLSGSVGGTPTGGTINLSSTTLTLPTLNQDLTLGTAGNGVRIKEGSNARMGTATLASGTVTVSNTSVTASTRIILSRASKGSSTALGELTVGTVTAATSFVINALKTSDATTETADVSVVNWLLVEPAP